MVFTIHFLNYVILSHYRDTRFLVTITTRTFFPLFFLTTLYKYEMPKCVRAPTCQSLSSTQKLCWPFPPLVCTGVPNVVASHPSHTPTVDSLNCVPPPIKCHALPSLRCHRASVRNNPSLSPSNEQLRASVSPPAASRAANELGPIRMDVRLGSFIEVGQGGGGGWGGLASLFPSLYCYAPGFVNDEPFRVTGWEAYWPHDSCFFILFYFRGHKGKKIPEK